jgi:hypothetical protein
MNLLPSIRKPKRIPRLPRMTLPDAVWRAYLKAFNERIIDEWRRLAIEYIVDKLPYFQRMVAAERPQGMRQDAWPDEVGTQLDVLSDKYDAIAKQSQDIAAGAFNAVNGVSHRQWYNIAKQVIGVDLFQFEPWIQSESKAFVTENVGLINKTGSDVLHDIRRVVMSGFRQGKRWETLRDEILTGTNLTPGVFQKVETRAQLIARDQCTKLYGDINGKRQENAGLTLYIWRTMGDERVVGTPGGKYPEGSKGHHNHWAMNGKVCKWNDATVYADTVKEAVDNKWKKRTIDMPKVHPGVEIQDRCYAEPVFETIFQ